MTVHRPVFSGDERLVGAEVCAEVRRSLERGGTAVLLVPDEASRLQAYRELAAEGLCLGVEVDTPLGWAKGRWETWGDGRRVIGAYLRGAVMGRVVAGSAGEAGSLADNPGTVRVLGRLAQGSLPWLVGPDGQPDPAAMDRAGLTAAERRALGLLASYAEAIHRLGYLEGCECLALLPGELSRQGVGLGAVVACGFCSLDRGQRELLRGLSRITDVLVVLRPGNAEAEGRMAASLSALAEGVPGAGDANPGGTTPSRGWLVGMKPYSRQGRPAELAHALNRLFGNGDPSAAPLLSEGAVELVLPAGPDAEAEAVARAVSGVVRGLRPRGAADASGAVRVVISAPDAPRAWRELAPKLVARGLSVRSTLNRPVMETEPGRALMGFLESVARLEELAEGWPPAEPLGTGKGRLVRLGEDMTWWPPSEVTDFLLSGLSGVPASVAMELDNNWRGNRLLIPADVLKRLCQATETSPAVAAATRALAYERCPERAVRALLEGLQAPVGDGGDADGARPCDDALAEAEARQALGSALKALDALREAGVSCDAQAADPVGLSALVGALRRILDASSMVVRPEARVQGSPAEVEILPPAEVARLPRSSADVVVLLGQTSVGSPVGTGDDVTSALVEGMGVEPGDVPMDRARSSFVGQLAVARAKVLVERTLFDASAKESYSSVMLLELLACYGLRDDLRPKEMDKSLEQLRARGIACHLLSETEAFRNSQAGGAVPPVQASDEPTFGGTLAPRLRPYVLVPAPNHAFPADGVPELSASQIQNYLECPLKWFAQNRLGLKEPDAGFTATEQGTFAHRVLQHTHEELLDKGWQAMGHEGPYDPETADLRERVDGCRPVEGRDETLRVAQETLVSVFDRVRTMQFARGGKRKRGKGANGRPLVPHTKEDDGTFDELRGDLLDTLRYEAGLFQGYEPRLFEQEFGLGEGKTAVRYADVYLNGAIDRVDVDAEGRAIVIDYKHHSPYGFADLFDVFGNGEWAPGEDGAAWLPRHVQALVYAQVFRRAHPDLTVTGSVYLCTRGQHGLAGAVGEDSVERVFGTHAPSERRWRRVAVPQGRMDELLDEVEEAIAAKVEDLRRGRIPAEPVDARACRYCPVIDCERRLS